MINFKQFLRESIEDKGIFKAVFFSGMPGSGKSYVAQRINDGKIDPRIVNTDKFYEWLAQSNDIPMDDVPRWVLDRSKTLNKSQLVNYINSILPLYIDGTSADANNLLRRSGILEGYGYDVGMVWIETSLETSLARARDRERKVDESFIRRVHEKLADNKAFYKKRFDVFKEINNDEGELTDEVILDAYREVSGFFHDKRIDNPIGRRTVSEMREKGAKYLAPEIYDLDNIKRNVEIWYKRK